MKYNRLFFMALAALLLTFVSCKKADAQSSISDSDKGNVYSSSETLFNTELYSEDSPEYKERNALQLATNSKNLVDFDSVKKFFTLDFTPEYPDSLFAETLKTSKASK